MKKNVLALAAFAAIGVASAARGAIVINEFSVNPPGGDNGQEFFEILSTSGGVVSLDGLSILQIEGDSGAAGGTGAIDKVIPLTGFSTGTNGLFLYRDSATVLSPAPDPETSVNVTDFNPDVENPALTILLVNGFTGVVNDDLDADGDGVFDSMPWTSVLDGFGFKDTVNVPANGPDYTYAASVGFTDFAEADLGFPLEGYIRALDGEPIAVDLGGTNPGPYTVIAASESLPAGSTLTPGNFNPEVPEPAGLGLIAVAGLAAARRRRSR